jgi:hypothetical protein
MKTKTFEDWSVNNMFQKIHDVSRKITIRRINHGISYLVIINYKDL